MKRIIPAMDELKRSLIALKLVESFLDASVIFFISYLVFMIFSIPWIWALLIFLGSLVVITQYNLRQIKLKDVETEVPQLKDQLRAAHDTMYKEGFIADSLHEDVVKMMKQIKTSYFVNFKKLWRELIIAGGLAFVIILVASLNIQLLDYKLILDDFSSLTGDTNFDKLALDSSSGGGFEGDESDIFGNESIAELGLEEVNLQINPVLSEININDIQDVKDKDFRETDAAREIRAGQSACGEECNEDFPNEHKEIVKRYFSQIAASK